MHRLFVRQTQGSALTVDQSQFDVRALQAPWHAFSTVPRSIASGHYREHLIGWATTVIYAMEPVCRWVRWR